MKNSLLLLLITLLLVACKKENAAEKNGLRSSDTTKSIIKPPPTGTTKPVDTVIVGNDYKVDYTFKADKPGSKFQISFADGDNTNKSVDVSGISFDKTIYPDPKTGFKWADLMVNCVDAIPNNSGVMKISVNGKVVVSADVKFAADGPRGYYYKVIIYN